MSGKEWATNTIFMEEDGGDELELSHGLPGTWKLYGASFTAHTTLAAHADDHQTITLKKEDGGTAIATMTSDVGATYEVTYTKGTPLHFTITGTGQNLEFTKDNCLEIAVTEGGTCAALNGILTVVWVRERVA